jgi:hypothetical protein
VLIYALLKPINNTLSLMCAAFRLTQAAVLGANLLNTCHVTVSCVSQKCVSF